MVLSTLTSDERVACIIRSLRSRYSMVAVDCDTAPPGRRTPGVTLPKIFGVHYAFPVMKPKPQVTIAHYQVIEPIGAGGMGAVYKAFDNKLQRIVALKVLPLEYVSQQDRRRRFFQEARAASALTHPHILTVYEVGEDNGKPYIAMEYVEGETLRQKIKSRSLDLTATLDISIQIAEGLGKAHEVGIIHRDLKPENLMIRRDGYAKILDFGLAKLVAQRERALAGDSEQKTLLRVETESGTLLGTVNYMAPEQ